MEVDPYAAYYEQYSNAVHTTGLTEKQGFAGAMENVFGDDAAVSSLWGKSVENSDINIIFFVILALIINCEYLKYSSFLELLVP